MIYDHEAENASEKQLSDSYRSRIRGTVGAANVQKMVKSAKKARIF